MPRLPKSRATEDWALRDRSSPNHATPAGEPQRTRDFWPSADVLLPQRKRPGPVPRLTLAQAGIPPNRNGARHCCQAPLRRGWICRCSLGARPEGPPLRDPDSPAQASLPIKMDPGILTLSFPRPIPRDDRLLRQRFASARRLWRPELPRPFLGWLPSRGLSPWGGNRPRKARNRLFRRLLPTGPVLSSAASSPRGAVLLRFSRPSPVGGDRTFRPFLVFRSLPTLVEAGASVPIT